MKIQERIDAVEADNKHLVLYQDVRKLTNTIAEVTLEFWKKVGTDGCIGYVEKYIVIDYNLPTEVCYKDIATVTQIVRARRW